MNNDLLQKIKQALQSEPNISDNVVLIRLTEQATEEVIVYFIPQGPIDQFKLQTRLSALLSEPTDSVYLVPLFKLPLNPDGSPNSAALAAIPVLDDQFIAESEQRLKRQEGVKNAAIVRVHYRDQEEIRYHLDDLLPAEQDQDTPQQTHVPATNELKINQNLPPALVDGGTLIVPENLQHKTLIDLLRDAASNAENMISFVSSNGSIEEWRYSDLWESAERIYAGLSSHLKAGDKVIFQMSANQDILSTFWACQMGGFIPVIMEVPSFFQSGNQALERVAGLLQLLKNPLVVADEATALAFSKIGTFPFDESLKICRIGDLKKCAPLASHHVAQPDDIAFFNLSSGSTGIPKCIMLTHRNLLARAYGTNQLCGYSTQDVILNWLPFDHIGSISDWHIRCVLLKCHLVYVEKDHVIGDPINWLNLINQFRVSHSWAPNFAFALINKKLETVKPPNWDLNCVKGLLTAGEAVSDSSVQDFIRSLSKFGFSNTAVQPAFGMAELGSGVTYFVPSETKPLRFHTLRKPAMGNTIERLPDTDPAATHFADLGPAIPGVSLRIVDNNNTVLPMETVGRLQIKGDVVFQGYYENPNANASSFQADGWFNTGDLGFLSDGNLVIAGREKEVIIIKGANYYSHEIEDIVSQVEGIESSYSAACGVRRIRDTEEKLAIFFVPVSADHDAELIRSIRTQVANRFGVSPTYLIPLDKQQIPKTAIGKIQRSQLKKRLEAGDFDEIIKRVDLILGNANTLPSWFYRSEWTVKRNETTGQRKISGPVLILQDSSGLGVGLSDWLSANQCPYISVKSGSRLERKDKSNYEIDFSSKSNVVELFLRIRDDGIAITDLVSLIEYGSDNGGQSAVGSYPNVSAFLNLVQGMVETDTIGQLKHIFWVASDCHTVSPDELGSASKAMMTGFTNALRMEYPSVDFVHLDLPFSNHSNNLGVLNDEFTSYSKEPSVSYRNGQRYVWRLAPLDLIKDKKTAINLQKGGLYVVTGGLGGLGFELCRRLGRDFQAKLLVLGRSPLRLDSKGDEDQSPQWQRYQTLINDRIDCRYAQVDTSDEISVLEQVKQAEITWDTSLNGIFHLAGIAYERPLSEESVESFTELARPKCEGIVAVGEIIKIRPGAFLVAFSSLNAAFGGSNISSISAANAFLDTYCRSLFRAGFPALSYDWSIWDGIGMSSNTAVKSIAAAKGFYLLSFEEGFNSMLALMLSGQPEALIGVDGTKNPIRVFVHDNFYEQQSVVGFLELSGTKTAECIPETILLHDRFGSSVQCGIHIVESLPLGQDGLVDKDRLVSLANNQGQTKKEPTNSVEAGLVEIWRDLLKVSDIGIGDNFFELGGDSLLTLQLIVLIEKAFDVMLPASTIFFAPTIEQLAETLADKTQIPDFFSLVPIKAEGSKPPLYIVQSDSWELVRYIDSDQPVYALNFGVGSTTLEGKLDLPESLEKIASHFVEEIRLNQPEGPYFIIGHSNAGLLAYEMAQQLVAQQQTVGLLGLIDTYYLPDLEHAPSLSIAEKFQELASLPFKTRLTVLQKLIIFHFSQIRNKFFTKSYEKPFLDRAMHLYFRYAPAPYPGSISYFKCVKRSSIKPTADHELAWKKLAQNGIRVHPIECHHDDVLVVPHVKLLADQITEHLENYYKTVS